MREHELFDIIYVPIQCWKELYLNFPFRIGLRCVAPACILLRLQLMLLLRASLFRMPPPQVLASFPSRLFTLTGLALTKLKSHGTLFMKFVLENLAKIEIVGA